MAHIVSTKQDIGARTNGHLSFIVLQKDKSKPLVWGAVSINKFKKINF